MTVRSSNPASIGSWSDVEHLLRDRPLGVLLRVPRGWLEHPRAHGMKPSIALPVGQASDYWKRLDEDHGLHVSAYNSFYVVRLQPLGKRPTTPPREARSDHQPSSGFDPDACAEKAVALGAIVGAMFGRTERSIVACAALAGGLINTMSRRRAEK